MSGLVTGESSSTEVIPNVLESPALPLILALEADGFTMELRANGRLRVGPEARLTPDRVAELRTYRDALCVLLRICRPDVMARREAFAEQLAAAPSPTVPNLVFRPGVMTGPGVCFSCGEDTPVYGLCLACLLARRLTFGHPIPSNLLTLYPDIRRVA